MNRLLGVITALGLGVLGLVVWVYFANSSGSAPSSPGACTSDRDRVCTRIARDGGVLLVTSDGSVVRLTAGHH